MYEHPYYIVSPPFNRTSAGVRVLFRLADMINRTGGSAFVHLRPHIHGSHGGSPMDIAPLLTQKTLDYHFANGLTPIVIYPEITRVAKLNPPVRVRYVLNYENLLFENDPIDDDDYILGYSENILARMALDKPASKLFIPVSDPIFFSPPPDGSPREGGCFYAGKYQDALGGELFPVTDGLPEITRDRADSQSPEQIRDLFRRCEFFYCYEDSALALEAMLTGCPTIFLPNPHFTATLGAQELEGLGFGWGDSEEQKAHAKATVGALRTRYFEIIQNAQDDLKPFLDQTQAIAKRTPYRSIFLKDHSLKVSRIESALALIRGIRDILEDRGLLGLIKLVKKRILSGRMRYFGT